MNNNIEERLQSIEDTLDMLVERQKETTDLVQGYLDSLADVIRDAEERIREACEETAERITGEQDVREELKQVLEGISNMLDALQGAKGSGDGNAHG